MDLKRNRLSCFECSELLRQSKDVWSRKMIRLDDSMNPHMKHCRNNGLSTSVMTVSLISS